jgi:uncharacterized protein (TIGR00661 family)
MGHAMRSRVVLDHLTKQGHDVHVVASQRAVEYLSKHFDSVHRIHGLSIVYEENRVRRGKTFWANVRDGLMALPGQIKAYFELIEKFRPDVVVSDFESWTYLYGKLHRLPVYSVDNIQMINRCYHDPEIRNADRAGFEVARAFVKGKLPSCEQYLITTFYYPEIRKDRTSLYPPILRPEIISTVPTEGEHLLVYQTAEGHEALADVLAASGVECRVYGMRRGIQGEQVEGNVRYMPFSEARFIADLASSRAVVAGGGFTLMSECVYLHKPVLSTPVGGQFEQTLNAMYLEREGYGRHAREIDGKVLGAFLEGVPDHAKALERYSQDGNRLLLGALDGFLLSAG